jgi:amidase
VRLLLIRWTFECVFNGVLGRSADYTMVWNALDYPALTIPVSKVDQTLDAKQPAHAFYSNADKANYESCTPVCLP